MAAKSMVHPVTRQVYTLTADGLVEVYDPATGLRGVFDEQGRYRSGDLRHADYQLAGWVGRLAHRPGVTGADGPDDGAGGS